MWIPKAFYERIPQYWLLLGLLFMSAGMYLGFSDRRSYFCFGVGLVCALWSMWTFSVRLRDRSTSQDAESPQAKARPDNVVESTMWLPASVYERIPQFMFLLGLFFMAAGLYFGFNYQLAYFYFGVGIICCIWGLWTFSVRLRARREHRQQRTMRTG